MAHESSQQPRHQRLGQPGRDLTHLPLQITRFGVLLLQESRWGGRSSLRRMWAVSGTISGDGEAAETRLPMIVSL
jgi:hypothetical protein